MILYVVLHITTFGITFTLIGAEKNMMFIVAHEVVLAFLIVTIYRKHALSSVLEVLILPIIWLI